ncbi:MoxR family ATPase [Dolichospermum sp. LEGE 00246]|uniref:AAA family ATPase n=1 Tax=Dolichospermum sp. LEGE 00246 TaxID=1828605 RepID=UPI00187FE348|nr:MoxR family ATPase [Dolichospermum sp. LEGE 00246]MBE9257084.1 MoxR family ATPase [Dolichospermum sp. LEGE 00246]
MVDLISILSTKDKPYYTGKSISPQECQSKGLFPYLPSPELITAVNLAIFLEKRPLLLKGEPGCGKTCLAQAVAHELGLPYEAWYIKSTTRARDGLYTYDAVGRLHDAQLSRMGEVSNSQVKDLDNYIKLGPLGRAFKNEKCTVVLIDEIDKADIDFPNDLLRELDEQKFTIEEKGEEVKANYPPIIIVTSNDEKDLPDAFLRRCLFYYIQFPDKQQLEEIVKSHFGELLPNLVKAAVQCFSELRQKMEKGKAGKKVSTSELLDWFAVLRQFPEDEVLKQLEGEIPFPEVLLKKWEDHLRYLKKYET